MFPCSPGSPSSLEREWRWRPSWSSPDSSCHLHCCMLPGEGRVQGQPTASSSKSSFSKASLVHDNSSKNSSVSPSGWGAKAGAAVLVCWENSQSSAWRCSCLPLSGQGGKGSGKDCYMSIDTTQGETTQGTDSMSIGCFTGQGKGLSSFGCHSSMTPLCTADYWKAPAAWAGKSLCTGQCRGWKRQSQS